MKVYGIGRLVADPEIRYTGGKEDERRCIANYRVAVGKKGKNRDDKDQADFFSCVSYGKPAEVAEKYLKKGSRIMISGILENNNYTDRNGNKVYQTRIVVEELEFADSIKEVKSESSHRVLRKEDFYDVSEEDADEEIESFM